MQGFTAAWVLCCTAAGQKPFSLPVMEGAVQSGMHDLCHIGTIASQYNDSLHLMYTFWHQHDQIA